MRTTQPLAPDLGDTPLTMPVGALLRPSYQIGIEDTIERAAAELRRSGNSLVPVLDGERLAGAVTEDCIAKAIGDARELFDSASSIMIPAPKIRSYLTGAEALRLFEEGIGPILVVVDDSDRVMGVLSASDLIPRKLMPPRPGLVGGMATPFGVYLTNGITSGGASTWALFTTGAAMFCMFMAAQILTVPLVMGLVHWGVADSIVNGVENSMPLILFLVIMRLVPLSGIHAAEHMTVHAIERGEELRPEVVSRMPRVHPRCGTNLATGAMLFLGIMGMPGDPYFEYRFVIGGIVALYSWRRLGSIAQFYVTTKRPNAKQIASGIKAGSELLDRFARSHESVASIPLRIWRSGLPQVLLGSTLTGLVFYLLSIPIKIWTGYDILPLS